MGNVVQAGVGQAPARQAAIFAGNEWKSYFLKTFVNIKEMKCKLMLKIYKHIVFDCMLNFLYP